MSGFKKVKYYQVAQGVWGMKSIFVNIYMIANRRGVASGWVLVDSGLKTSAKKIIAMAESLFGLGTRPKAIVLTHGHSDHTGALKELLKHWPVPVYAHQLELPYLTGRSAYPPADPTVSGGVMSLLSVFFRTNPINLGRRVKAIDMHEGIPELPEWRVIHTPGHTPGHISLFLPLNTTLLAGDALATTKTESAVCVLGGLKQLSGPPKFITTDWAAAQQSIEKLAELQPRIVAPGHGPVMRGRELSEMRHFVENFEAEQVPKSGRYVNEPAVADELGVHYIPPFKTTTAMNVAVSFTAAILAFAVTYKLSKYYNG